MDSHRERLSKLMALTTSDNDHEALAALRMANALMARSKTTWAELLSSPGSVKITFTRGWTAEDWLEPEPHLRDKDTIEAMFRAVYALPRAPGYQDEFWTFIDNIHHRWEQYGNLSQKEYELLKRTYNRTTRSNA